MAYSDYSLQPPRSPTWFSKFSVRAQRLKDKWSGKPTDPFDDQVSVVSAPGSLPSPVSSALASDITPSPSSSTSSWSSISSLTKTAVTESTIGSTFTNSQVSRLPSIDPSPALSSPPALVKTSLKDYFLDRPLPTQRRISRQRSAESDISNNTIDPALTSLAQGAFTFFISSPSSHQHATLIQKLQGNLATTTPAIHPSLLQLTKDVLTYMHQSPPVSSELSQLKPKLDACVRIHLASP
ncbi:hypothetical protein DM01DRAFT_322222 [Hesseltinella vesiculosa]|uniref:Uncharacterized protein n=1 Tax=Hesseltinella vesiculosa TaxID=101127 RepID=A0A1X2GIH4_9FUNG|nr:hypothetical protein DM01DRAFT_322222 [Hesseltinella vesiculosa]